MINKRICALYSKGPHYLRMIHCLRENYPDATIVAAVPLDFPFDVINDLVDETLPMPSRHENSGFASPWKSIQQIRSSQCTHLVVMFDSPRLHILGRLSGVANRRCFTVDGRFYPLNHGILPLIKQVVGNAILGRWNYFLAWHGTRKGQ